MKQLREDLQLREYARSKGWSIDLHGDDKRNNKLIDFESEPARVPYFTLNFRKGKKVVWFCAKGWACADLVPRPEHYANHRYKNSLKEVLDVES